MPFQLRRGTNAERLTITPLAGEIIYTTDTKLLYVGDGSTIGGVTGNNSISLFTQNGTGAVARTIDSKLKDVISVKDFGSVGDGVVDDTSTIQAALNAAGATVANGIGKSVYIPSGTYKITSTLEIKEGTKFFGDQNTSVISVQPTGSTATYNDGLLIKGNNVVIDGLRFDGTNEGREINGGVNINRYAAAILADPAISGATYQNPTIKNCSIFKWGLGIELRRVNNFAITDNRFWGGKNLKDGNSPNASTVDINIYGSSTPNDSFRGIISGNFCFGNNDSNISAAGNQGDHDITITGNVIWPLKEDLTPLSKGETGNNANANMSRYGIIVGYAGNCSVRTVISNNVIRDVAHCAINTQTFTRPGGDLAIVGNMISECGFGKIYPTDNSLKAGIFLDGGADTCANNVIVDCYTVGIKHNSGAAVPTAPGRHARAVISGNNISNVAQNPQNNTLGYGIQISGNNTSGVMVSNNRVENTANVGIVVGVGAGATNGNVHINGNSVQVGHTYGGIQVSNGGDLDCSVVGNRIVGVDNITSNSTFNSGIWSDLGVGKVHCIGNVIEKFYFGIRATGTSTTVNSRDLSLNISNNTIKNCTYGIGGAGGLILCQANTISGSSLSNYNGNAWGGIITTSSNSSGYSGKSTVIVSDSQIPDVTGLGWVRGDRCINSNPTVGSPKGWICTVGATGGTAGTWVSEGNL